MPSIFNLCLFYGQYLPNKIFLGIQQQTYLIFLRFSILKMIQSTENQLSQKNMKMSSMSTNASNFDQPLRNKIYQFQQYSSRSSRQTANKGDISKKERNQNTWQKQQRNLVIPKNGGQKDQSIKQSKNNENINLSKQKLQDSLDQNERLSVFDKLYFLSRLQILKDIYTTPKNKNNNQRKKTFNKRSIKTQRSSNKSLPRLNIFNKKKKQLEQKSNERITTRTNIAREKVQNATFRNKRIVNSLYKDKRISIDDSFISNDHNITREHEQNGINITQFHFFEKMHFIFYDSQLQNISIGQNLVSLLTAVEFKILLPFIMWIEENAMKKQDFDQNLYSFYNSLHQKQKKQLLWHEKTVKLKYVDLKYGLTIKKNSKKQSKIELKSMEFKKQVVRHKKKIIDTYLMKICNFV